MRIVQCVTVQTLAYLYMEDPESFRMFVNNQLRKNPSVSAVFSDLPVVRLGLIYNPNTQLYDFRQEYVTAFLQGEEKKKQVLQGALKPV